MGETKAMKAQKKTNKKKGGKARPSLTGWLAWFIVPLITFIGGNFVVNEDGFIHGNDMRSRFAKGLQAVFVTYLGFDFAGRFKGRGMLQGYGPILLNYGVRKSGINRQVPRSVPIIL